MILLRYAYRFVEERDVLDYLKQKGYLSSEHPMDRLECVRLVRKIIKANNIRESDIADSIPNPVTTSEIKHLSLEDRIAFAQKHGLFFNYKHVWIDPEEYARTFYSEGLHMYAYEVSDITIEIWEQEEEINRLQQKVNMVIEKFNTPITAQELIPSRSLLHIKPTFNFSDFSERFRYLNGNEIDGEVFWHGTDREVGYDTEVMYMLEAVDAKAEGLDKINVEVIEDRDLYEYSMLVKELLSAERLKIFYDDYVALKSKHREYYDKQMELNVNFKRLWEYVEMKVQDSLPPSLRGRCTEEEISRNLGE